MSHASKTVYRVSILQRSGETKAGQAEMSGMSHWIYIWRRKGAHLCGHQWCAAAHRWNRVHQVRHGSKWKDEAMWKLWRGDHRYAALSVYTVIFAKNYQTKMNHKGTPVKQEQERVSLGKQRPQRIITLGRLCVLSEAGGKEIRS